MHSFTEIRIWHWLFNIDSFENFAHLFHEYKCDLDLNEKIIILTLNRSTWYMFVGYVIKYHIIILFDK